MIEDLRNSSVEFRSQGLGCSRTSCAYVCFASFLGYNPCADEGKENELLVLSIVWLVCLNSFAVTLVRILIDKKTRGNH